MLVPCSTNASAFVPSASGPVAVGLAYFTKTRLGSPAAYGTLISSLAAGSLIGAVLAGLWKIRRRGILILLVAVVLGLCLGSIALAERTWSVAGILVVMGAARKCNGVRFPLSRLLWTPASAAYGARI
jgi:hypothetical protein